jgi:hypothetical protein
MRPSRDPWLENALLLGILALLVGLYLALPGRTAQAAGGGWETDGMIAVTGTGGSKLVLIDTVKKNMCIYKVLGLGQFRLVGARSYKYDVEIKDSANSPMERQGWTYVTVRAVYEQQMKAGVK